MSNTTNELGKILSLPHRERRPRVNGLNVIYDPGLPIWMLEVLLADNQHIDAMEIGSGGVFIDNSLNERIRICEKNGITPFLSGLVLDIFLSRNKVDDYTQMCKDYALKTFQVNDSCMDMAHKLKCELVKKLSEHGHVYSRIGADDPSRIIPPYKWIEMIEAELEAGAKYIFAGGGVNGNMGIYRGSGEIREGLVEEILTKIPAEKIVWDAPNHRQRVYFIDLLGANCNFGQLIPKQILQIEATRLGLNLDTFFTFFGKEKKAE